ncbi:MAG TPA: nitroreductase family protein [Anaerolineae bacterium]|nr:nitroreductase family protein [Anaerolineae bacterium]
MTSSEEPILNAIYARRSIRKFVQDKPVERAKLETLLKAAMAAPSACNIQPWDFIIIEDKESIRAIQEGIAQYAGYNPSVVLVICGSNEFIPWKGYGIVDCACAMENIMIAAPALGLGTVCIGGFDRGKVKAQLEIPENIEAVGMLYVGYPDEEKPPRTKYLEEAVHWGKYDKARPRNPRPGNILEFGPEASL